MNSDVFKSHWCGFHDNTQIPRESAPRYYQVARSRVEDSPINAMSYEIMVWRLLADICLRSKKKKKKHDANRLTKITVIFSLYAPKSHSTTAMFLFLTNVINSGRIGPSRAGRKILDFGNVPCLGMVPLYQG